MHFRQLFKECDELKHFEPELACVLSDIASLHSELDGLKKGRILRASEIIKKHTRIPEAVVESQEQELLTVENAKKEVPVIRTDLSHDDFKSMLEVAAPKEEKLSTKAIRERLGLVDRLGGQMSTSDAVALEEQESIQSEMMSLAKQLKDRTQTINQSLTEDVKILDAVGQSADSNTALLDRENAKLKVQLASSIGFWTSLWLIAMLVVVFIVTYCYMKIFSRRW